MDRSRNEWRVYAGDIENGGIVADYMRDEVGKANLTFPFR